MDRRSGEKSRREKRKEARSIKKVQKHQSWIQKSQKKKETIDPLKSKNVKKSKESLSQNSDSGSDGDYKSERPTIPNDIPRLHDSDSDRNLDSGHPTITKKVPRLHDSAALKRERVNKPVKKKSKTKFEEYLEMSMPNAGMSAKEDMELERKLAKRLKIKGGQLRGMDDGMNMLFEGMSSILEEDAIKEAEDFDPKSLEKHSSRKKRKKKMSSILEEDAIKDAEDFDPKSLEKPSSRKKRKKKMSSEQSPEDDEMAADASVGLSEKAEISDVGTSAGLPDKEPSGKKRKKRKESVNGQEGSKAGDAPTFVPNAAINCVAEVAEERHIKTPAVKGNVKYIAPHLRSRVSNESEENAKIRRRIRGLLNRLSESNVESITGEISTIVSSVGRSAGSLIISEEVVKSCSEGPRGNEQYAAVFAAFVAGMSCLVGIDFGAKLLASVAKTFEDEYLKEDNLSLRNITLLLSYLCIFGVCSSDLIYDFLIMLSKRLLEIDVSTILTILQCCGMKIRSDDPTSMKSFILSVQNRVNDLKVSAGDGNENIIGKRMEFMLETICDIKNNKKRTKEDSIQQTRIKKWLQKLRVEDILIRGVTWNKLLDPNKKGQWWLSSDLASATDNVEELASTIDKEVLEAQKMLQLAAAQRMTTDARKAIFCIVMSGEDYIDAFEKLLRLDLHGKQDREIMRVLVDCCLQEKVFNKYYAALASKLCEHDKNHKFTLQFCLWDHFKELESMNLQRSMHLAKFVAEMIASFTLSVAVLKAVDLSDCKQLTPKRMMHFRMLFEAILGFPDKLVWNIFTRAAVASDLEPLRNGIEFFIKEYVVRTNNAFSGKYKVAKKALNNMEGVLM